MHIPAWFALWFNILGLPKIITGVVFVKCSERNDNIPTFGIESVMKKRRSSLIQFSEKKDRRPIEAVAGLSGTWRVCDVIASGEIMPSRAETTVGLNPNNPARSVGFIQNSVSKF